MRRTSSPTTYTAVLGTSRSEPVRRKIRKALDEPGHAHFLTYSCLRCWPLLSSDRIRHWVVEGMEETRRRLDVALWAYVIMPEHVHLLLFPESECPMRRVLAALKRGVSKRARSYLIETGQHDWLERLTIRHPSRTVFRFWQPGGGYDHNIWKQRTLREVVGYIHANPVRRGLVESPEDWYWSSARFWTGEKSVPIAMDPVDV